MSPACGAINYPNIVIIAVIQTFDYQKSEPNIKVFQRVNYSFVVIIPLQLKAVFHFTLRLRTSKWAD